MIVVLESVDIYPQNSCTFRFCNHKDHDRNNRVHSRSRTLPLGLFHLDTRPSDNRIPGSLCHTNNPCSFGHPKPSHTFAWLVQQNVSRSDRCRVHYTRLDNWFFGKLRLHNRRNTDRVHTVDHINPCWSILPGDANRWPPQHFLPMHSPWDRLAKNNQDLSK